jgi:hypothetical protein
VLPLVLEFVKIDLRLSQVVVSSEVIFIIYLYVEHLLACLHIESEDLVPDGIQVLLDEVGLLRLLPKGEHTVRI